MNHFVRLLNEAATAASNTSGGNGTSPATTVLSSENGIPTCI